MKYNDLKERNIYLNQLIAFKDTEPVKVITGIRRCGKSSLLKLMQEYLLKSGVGKDQIISINFESLEFHDINMLRKEFSGIRGAIYSLMSFNK